MKNKINMIAQKKVNDSLIIDPNIRELLSDQELRLIFLKMFGKL